MQCKEVIDKIIARQLKRKQIFLQPLLNTFTLEELNIIFPPYKSDFNEYKEEIDEIYRAVESYNVRSIKMIIRGCQMMFPHKVGGTYFTVDNWCVEMDSDEKTNEVTMIKYSDDFENPGGTVDISKSEFLDLVQKVHAKQG